MKAASLKRSLANVGKWPILLKNSVCAGRSRERSTAFR